MAEPSVVIVGGGVAGLACARVLASADVPFQIYDKGRGPGGRCSTRRSAFGGFDHGAPFFFAEDPRFLRQASRWVAAGAAKVWEPVVYGLPLAHSSVYVGTPGMNAILKSDAKAHGAEFGVRVAPLEDPANGVLSLRSEGGEPLAEASVVVLATPAPQTAELLPEGSPLKSMASGVTMLPRWTVMAATSEPASPAGFDIMLPDRGCIEKIIREPSKPSRDPAERFVIHANPVWSAEHLEADAEAIAELLFSQFKEVTGLTLEAQHLTAHRWRYAEAAEPAGQPFGFDEERSIATCGDWHLGQDVEAAYLSGYELGHMLKERL